jgi:hypothetical protein
LDLAVGVRDEVPQARHGARFQDVLRVVGLVLGAHDVAWHAAKRPRVRELATHVGIPKLKLPFGVLLF